MKRVGLQDFLYEGVVVGELAGLEEEVVLTELAKAEA